MRKTVIRFSDHVQHIPGSIKQQKMAGGLKSQFQKVEVLYYYMYMYEAKTKALISIAQLTCAFVFSYAGVFINT